MTLEELYAAIGEDFTINEADLGHEAVRTSDLFVKYIKLYSQEKLKLETLDIKRKQLIAKKRDYYAGNGKPEEYKEKPFDLKVKSEAGIQKYVESDDDVVRFDQAMLIQKSKVEVLINCLDEIKRRGFSIKTALDHTKFMNGG